MSRFANAPEALLGRNDSKNPASTCKGITSSGRSCRRGLTTPKSSPLQENKSSLSSVVALVSDDGEICDADFYCWQHKDQAQLRVVDEQKAFEKSGRRAKRKSTELYLLQERSSIDTLVQRLGIEASPEKKEKTQPSRMEHAKPNRPRRRTETHDFAVQHSSKDDAPERPMPESKSKGFWTSLCCMAGGDEDYVEVVRHRKRVEQTRPSMSTAHTPVSPTNRPAPSIRPSTTSAAPRKSISRPQTGNHDSGTNQLLSLIPQSLSPQTASALLAELVKPTSAKDEDGYIYIFWLTPQTQQAPGRDAALSLLSPSHRLQNERCISDVMTEFSFSGSEPASEGKKTIMLKIGRASNVTRRMNEWQRQCGYALNLVRWYPYISSAATPSPSRQEPLYPDLSRPLPAQQRRESGVVRKVPYVKRVERLIHLELAEKQVKKQCNVCQREHREWFEAEASHAGIKAVDECVKRWVAWAEKEVARVNA